MKVWFLLFGFSFVSCGLFHRGVPKAGEFCNVLVKPPECIFVDFEKQTLVMDEIKYQLSSTQRLSYFFEKDKIVYDLWVTAEHRVEIKEKDSNKTFKFYMRKKPPSVGFFERLKKFWEWIRK
ncbi:hypothetical protein P3G55_06200 [Leptospira sp. 96542]|nr:hypothetical protein [Leptospira sp. 96542]